MKQIEKDNDLKVDQSETQKALIADAIKKVNIANDTSVLMSVICEKLGLKSEGLTHAEFVEAFTTAQTESLAAQKYLQEKFLVAPVPEKLRKKRMRNVKS